MYFNAGSVGLAARGSSSGIEKPPPSRLRNRSDKVTPNCGFDTATLDIAETLKESGRQYHSRSVPRQPLPGDGAPNTCTPFWLFAAGNLETAGKTFCCCCCCGSLPPLPTSTCCTPITLALDSERCKAELRRPAPLAFLFSPPACLLLAPAPSSSSSLSSNSSSSPQEDMYF
eukprot:CAMPEP_0178454728 /NCGR_PEP_ID=MMETSP0689_2-20121128/45528_1 /TAXON_ID=160604 /ORGANISM="Amphidinium massartii, Strain CS-259" /LENGTH=171 /DNA_ID=CAMNT_0020080711 /DNA_START=245 /DNA_END=758 /DNA_ORIENTATION=+